MGEYHIVGGSKIEGEAYVHGGKNAILPILASVVLNQGISIIHNCPKISDTYTSIDILKALGCKVEFIGNTITVDSSKCDSFHVPENLVREMRSSIIFLGGILSRFNEVVIGYPGGCELGARPIDLHLKALKLMGVEIKEDHGFIICKAKKLVGTEINLDFPSVGATENIMLTAVLANGITLIRNAAKEPEIVDMAEFLLSMGADISGAGTDTISIKGVKELHDCEFEIMPDRIVAGTLLVAAAMTKGEIVLTNAMPEHMYPITNRLEETGCSVMMYKKAIKLKAPEIIKPIDILRTHPHPGFPTDLQPQFMAYLVMAKGISVIIETVFESRNKHISELRKMGADIILASDGMTSVIKGGVDYFGSIVSGRDLRGGAALILAGLAAEGKTVVLNSNYVERGYENIENILSSLGGNVKLVV